MPLLEVPKKGNGSETRQKARLTSQNLRPNATTCPRLDPDADVSLVRAVGQLDLLPELRVLGVVPSRFAVNDPTAFYGARANPENCCSADGKKTMAQRVSKHHEPPMFLTLPGLELENLGPGPQLQYRILLGCGKPEGTPKLWGFPLNPSLCFP